MPATKLDVVAGDRSTVGATGTDREDTIRAGVLAVLGRPVQPFRLVVAPLWEDHYRVNVVTGDDPSSVRIPHSFFVAADGRGNILKSTPNIRRAYPLTS